MSANKVIVFGPTGAVGSVAAITAGKLGAHVYLAMRDVNKAIPGLDAAAEKSGQFERVQADLSKPDTVREAVSSTGAERAFIYAVHFAPDGMKATIEALKAAGIELLVFLSSYTVREPLDAIPQSAVIPFVHARVEINGRQVFGDNFIAARPGFFASNTVANKGEVQEIHSGHVKRFGLDAVVDCIVPADIGRVCGTVLAKGPQDDSRAIYIYGPELLTLRQTIETLGQTLGKSITVEEATKESAHSKIVNEHKFPEPLANYAVERMEKSAREGGDQQVYGYPVTKEELSNVQKYSGQKGVTFREWANQNKHLFSSSP